MGVNDQIDNLKGRLDEWEDELMELSESAQQETEEAGKKIREKYDNKLTELQGKVEETRKKLNDLV